MARESRWIGNGSGRRTMQIGTISKGSGLVGETIGRRQRTLGGLITMHRGYLQTTQSQTRGRE